MARTTNKEIMETLLTMNNILASLDARITALETGSSKTAKQSQKKTKKNAPSSLVIEVKDFEPKKDSDGHYNWASYKACRRKYAEAVSGKKLHGDGGQWIEANEFKKLVAPFDKAFKYVKKEDR